MKIMHIFLLFFMVIFSNLFSEATKSQKLSIFFDSENKDSTDTCSLILTTVNDTLRLLLSQTDSYEVISDITHEEDITIKTAIHSINKSFFITAECKYMHDNNKSFTIESNQFEVFQTFSEADNIALQIINTLSGTNYSIQKIVINNGSIPNNIEIYLNDKHIRNEDLTSILSGSYHLQIKQTSSSGIATILDINPLIINKDCDISLSLPVNGINEIPKKLVTKNSYTSADQFSAFPDWNDDWKLNENGQTIILFHAKAIKDIFVGFANSKEQDAIKYQFNIGGWENTQSVLRSYKSYFVRDTNSAVIITKSYRIKQNNDYWIIFDKNNNSISFGFGLDYTKNGIFFYKSKKSLSNIMYFSFSSWDTPVEYSNISVLDN